MAEIMDSWGDEFDVDLDAKRGKKPKKNKPEPEAGSANHVNEQRVANW